MANTMLTDDLLAQKHQDNELIYFSSIICQILTDIEYNLRNCFPDDLNVSLLISLKDKWVSNFRQRSR